MNNNWFAKVFFAAIVVALLICASSATAFAATTYYVSTSGNDANQGSSAAPFKTVTKAVYVAQPGDTVIVRGGIYNEQVSFVRDGTSFARITIKGEPGAVMDSDRSKASAFVFGGHDYIRVEGFEVRDYTSDAFNANSSANGGAHYNEIVENYIHDIGTFVAGNTASSMFNRYGSHNLFANNRVMRVSGYGYRTWGSYDIVRSNDISQAGIDQVYAGGTGHLIEGNYLHDTRALDPNEHADGIQFYSPTASTGVVIRNNTVERIKTNGIIMGGFDGIEVYNNVVASSNGGGNAIGFDGSGAPQRNGKVYNNTVIGFGIGLDTGSGTTYHYNNVAVAVSGGSSSIKSATYSGNNVRYTNIADAKFVDPAKGDYHLQQDSPLINKGTNNPPSITLPATDKDGAVRIVGGTIDIGAYEYQTQLDNTPPAVSFITPTEGAVVKGTSVTIEVSATDSDGIAKVEFYVGGVLHRTEYLAPYTDGFNSTKYSDGELIIIAKAFDSKGAVTQKAITVTVDNVANPAPEPTPLEWAKAKGLIPAEKTGTQVVTFDDLAYVLQKLFAIMGL